MSHGERDTSRTPVVHHRPGQRPLTDVNWDRIAGDLRDAQPPTDDDVSRALDGTPLTSAASIVRHMAEIEAEGVLDTGRMFRDLLQVLEDFGEDEMMAEMWRRHG